MFFEPAGEKSQAGALSIVWDCMAEGAQNEQRFVKTYKHISAFSGGILERNPMFTERAKEIWQEKQKLTRDFISQLAYDLAE